MGCGATPTWGEEGRGGVGWVRCTYQDEMFMIFILIPLIFNFEMLFVQNEKKRKRKMQEKEGKSKKKDFKF